MFSDDVENACGNVTNVKKYSPSLSLAGTLT